MIKIGSYVRQFMFENSHGQVYRYGIVIDNVKDPPLALQGVRVVFSPRKDHPVGSKPYTEEIAASKLEVVCE